MKYVITTRGLRPLASADLTATIAKRAGDENAAPQGGGGVTMDGAKLFRSIKKRYRDDPGAALEAMVKKAITDARHTLRAAAKAAAQEEPVTARKAAEPDPPMSVAELRRQFETEAQAMVGPTGDRGTALLRFAQTERGKHLNRQLQIAMQHEHEARQRGGVTKQAPVGSPAWQRIEQAAEALIAKASTSLTKAQAIDRVVRDDPGLYAGHLAEVRPPVSGPTAAWAQIERRAAEIVEKSAHGVSKAKAVRQAIERDPGLYAEHVAQQRARV